MGIYNIILLAFLYPLLLLLLLLPPSPCSSGHVHQPWCVWKQSAPGINTRRRGSSRVTLEDDYTSYQGNNGKVYSQSFKDINLQTKGSLTKENEIRSTCVQIIKFQISKNQTTVKVSQQKKKNAHLQKIKIKLPPDFSSNEWSKTSEYCLNSYKRKFVLTQNSNCIQMNQSAREQTRVPPRNIKNQKISLYISIIRNKLEAALQ